MNDKLKKVIQETIYQVLILLGFFVITLIYFSPAFEGKVLRQMDVENAKALAHEVKALYDSTGHYSPWTNAVFSGMPTYNIFTKHKNNIFEPIKYILRLFDILPYYSAAIFFLYLLNFYLLLLAFRINKWLSALLSIGFALSSYNKSLCYCLYAFSFGFICDSF